MKVEEIIKLVLIPVLLIFSAFFSSTETALFSLDTMQIRKMRKNSAYKRIRQLLGESSTLLITLLLGNTMVNVALSSLMEGIVPIENTIIQTVIVTAILLFFGEISPKAIAINFKEPIAAFNSRLIYPLFLFFKPITKPITGLSNLILKALNRMKQEGETIDDDHLAALLSMVAKEGFLEAEEKKLVESVLKFAQKDVSEIMTPRNKLVSIKDSATVKKAIEILRTGKHSKMPVYSKTDDNIIGTIDIRHIFPYLFSSSSIDKMSVKEIMEPMYFVPPTKKLSEMLEDFKTRKIKIATVVDEYGSALGVVSIADVLGEIAGEIIDESFDIQRMILPLSEKRYLVSGDISLDDFNEFFKTKLSSEEFDTIAGYIIESKGDIPPAGFSMEIERYTLHVRDRSASRIDKCIVERR
ncbi:MAG: hypothetical protein A2Y33_04795 [Spirochaetes bacterium GWF1_51_8]|nr:MAG: hypothetical protein A2Y33_04795 [Spirochaetes bacterium GWF1_51_8]